MKKKVLIVDDDEKLNKMLCFLFNAKGFEVTTASDGIRAIELLETTAPDVIILDLMMPVMDGFKFMDWLNEDEIMKSTPRIVLSSMGYSDCIGKNAAMETVEFLGKPFKSADLLGKVSKVLS